MIRPELDESLDKWVTEDIKQQHIEVVIKPLLQQLISAVSSMGGRRQQGTFPSWPHFLNIPYVRNLIESAGEETVTSNDVNFLISTLKSAFATITDQVQEEWHARLLKLLGTDDKNQLNMAKVLFQCQSCYECRSYPSVLAHRCLMLQLPVNAVTIEFDSNGRFIDSAIRAYQLQIEERLRLVDTRIERIISTCGLAPATATSQQMDDLDLRLSCTHCRLGSKKKLFMTWRDAVCV